VARVEPATAFFFFGRHTCLLEEEEEREVNPREDRQAAFRFMRSFLSCSYSDITSLSSEEDDLSVLVLVLMGVGTDISVVVEVGDACVETGKAGETGGETGGRLFKGQRQGYKRTSLGACFLPLEMRSVWLQG
jgi:hypothetical protein